MKTIWVKVNQYTYKFNTWRIVGSVTKDNPQRIPKVVYFVKRQGKNCPDFPGGSLVQAKMFVQAKMYGFAGAGSLVESEGGIT